MLTQHADELPLTPAASFFPHPRAHHACSRELSSSKIKPQTTCAGTNKKACSNGLGGTVCANIISNRDHVSTLMNSPDPCCWPRRSGAAGILNIERDSSH